MSLSVMKFHAIVFLTAVANIFLTGYVGGIVVLYYVYYFILALIGFSCIAALLIEVVARIRRKRQNTTFIYTTGRILRNFLVCIILTVMALIAISLLVRLGLFLKTAVEDLIATSTPTITVRSSSGDLKLKVPKVDFVSQQYRPNHSGNYTIYIGRKVTLAGEYHSRSVRSTYLDRFKKYNVQSSGEFYGLSLYKEHRGGGELPYMFGDHYVPIDENVNLAIRCSTSTTGYTGCARVAKNDSGRLHYSYRLEPDELEDWLRIETEIKNKLEGYIQRE